MNFEEHRFKTFSTCENCRHYWERKLSCEKSDEPRLISRIEVFEAGGEGTVSLVERCSGFEMKRAGLGWGFWEYALAWFRRSP